MKPRRLKVLCGGWPGVPNNFRVCPTQKRTVFSRPTNPGADVWIGHLQLKCHKWRCAAHTHWSCATCGVVKRNQKVISNESFGFPPWLQWQKETHRISTMPTCASVDLFREGDRSECCMCIYICIKMYIYIYIYVCCIVFHIWRFCTSFVHRWLYPRKRA